VSTWKLASDGDLDLSSGTLQWIDGIDAIAQRVRTRLQFFRGEWFLDQRLGVPWFQVILGAKGGEQVAAQILRAVIEGTPGVDRVDELSLDLDGTTRTAAVAFRATTISGEAFQVDAPLIVG
jgi:hypothetical protein